MKCLQFQREKGENINIFPLCSAVNTNKNNYLSFSAVFLSSLGFHVLSPINIWCCGISDSTAVSDVFEEMLYFCLFLLSPLTCCFSHSFLGGFYFVLSHLICQNVTVLDFCLWIQLQLLTDAFSCIITFFALFLGQVSFLLSFLNPVFRPDMYWFCLVSPVRFSFFYTTWTTFLGVFSFFP